MSPVNPVQLPLRTSGAPAHAPATHTATLNRCRGHSQRSTSAAHEHACSRTSNTHCNAQPLPRADRTSGRLAAARRSRRRCRLAQTRPEKPVRAPGGGGRLGCLSRLSRLSRRPPSRVFPATRRHSQRSTSAAHPRMNTPSVLPDQAQHSGDGPGAEIPGLQRTMVHGTA